MIGGPVPAGDGGGVKELAARYAGAGGEEAYIQYGDRSTYTSWRNKGEIAFAPWTRIGV
jgi:hypothetical protein